MSSCGTSALIRKSSTASPKPARFWRDGATTIDTAGLTDHWARLRPQRAGRSSWSGAPLGERSPDLKPWTMKASDSHNKQGSQGAQVKQIIGMLRVHEVELRKNELCRQYGISDVTSYM
jgi:hypothetical protein